MKNIQYLPSTYYFADFGLGTFGMFMIRILIIKIRSMIFYDYECDYAGVG